MTQPCEWCNKDKFNTFKQEREIASMFPRSLITDPYSSGASIFDPNDTYADEQMFKLKSYFCQCPKLGDIFPDGSEYKGGDPKGYEGFTGSPFF